MRPDHAHHWVSPKIYEYFNIISLLSLSYLYTIHMGLKSVILYDSDRLSRECHIIYCVSAKRIKWLNVVSNIKERFLIYFFFIKLQFILVKIAINFYSLFYDVLPGNIQVSFSYKWKRLQFCTWPHFLL